MTKHINIDEILTKYKHWFTHQFTDPKSGLTLDQAKQQLYDLMLEIIGDDLFPPIYDREWDYVQNTNRLRQEQRQKLTDLFKGDGHAKISM